MTISLTSEHAKLIHLVGEEDCGLCDKSGAIVTFFTPKSRRAHQECINQIKPCCEKTTEIARSYFKSEEGFLHFNLCHVAVFEAVQKAIGSVTFKAYIDENGQEKLKELFENTGLAALQNYCSNYK
jgi:hypothetical protein